MKNDKFILNKKDIKDNSEIIKAISEDDILGLIKCITVINLLDGDIEIIIDKIKKISNNYKEQIPYSLISYYIYETRGNYDLELVKKNISIIITNTENLEDSELNFILKIK